MCVVNKFFTLLYAQQFAFLIILFSTKQPELTAAVQCLLQPNRNQQVHLKAYYEAFLITLKHPLLAARVSLDCY